MPIFGVLGSIGAIAKGVKAKKQRKEAEKIDDTRPVYTRPKEIDQNVLAAQNRANSGKMPGQEAIQSQMDQQQASALEQVNTGGGSATNRLAAISQINRAGQSGQMQLGAQGAQFAAQAQDRVADARSVRAGYKDLEFDYNKNQEFQYRRRKKNMLQAAGDKNAMGMWNDFQQQANSAANMGMQAVTGGTFG